MDEVLTPFDTHPETTELFMPTLLRRYWFLCTLPVVMGLGALFPGGGQSLRERPWILALLVAAILLISGYGLRVRRLVRQALHVRAVTLALLSTYAVAPLLAFGLARLWGPPIDGPHSVGAFFLQSVCLAAAQSSTLATTLTLTRMAGGDDELALVLTLLSSTLTALFTPWILRVSVGATVSFRLAEMMQRIALVVVLPVFVGQGLRWLTPVARRGPAPWLQRIQQAIILVFVYVAFAAAAPYFQSQRLLVARFFGVAVSLHFALLLWTYAAASALRLSPAERVAVVYSGSQKSVPNGIYLWQTYFPHNPFGAVALVVYQLFQLVAGFLLVPRFRRQTEAAAAAYAALGKALRRAPGS